MDLWRAGGGIPKRLNAMAGLSKLQKSAADIHVKTVFCADIIEEAKGMAGQGGEEAPEELDPCARHGCDWLRSTLAAYCNDRQAS